MLRMIAFLFGVAFILAGVAGYLPSFTQNGLLFGYFMVNPMHNMVHIVSGLVAIFACTNAGYAKWFFRLFGIIYGLVAISGFYWHGDLMMMHMNMADNMLHTVIAIVSLYLGFVAKIA